jgi:hypothetical protein
MGEELGTTTGTTTEEELGATEETETTGDEDEVATGRMDTPPNGVLTMIGGTDTTLEEELATVDKVDEVSDPPMGAPMPEG